MQSILTEADALLVVSNIRRACNDKSAKDLLSRSLRQQLLTHGFHQLGAASRKPKSPTSVVTPLVSAIPDVETVPLTSAMIKHGF